MSDSDIRDVSVVIPVYNGMKYLYDAVTSVLAQTLAPREIVLVDDGSTDDSALLIRRMAGSTSVPLRYLQQSNQGTAAARNRGIEMSSAPLVAFLDQDDLWLPGKLARQCEALRCRPGAGYSITLVESFMDGGGPPPAWLRTGWLEGPRPFYLPSCLLVRRGVLDRVGVFDAALRNGGDTDWFVRVREAGVGVAIVDELLVRYRVHGGNQSRLVGENRQEYLGIVRNALRRRQSHDLSPME